MKTFIKDCRWGQFLLLRGDMVSTYTDIYGEWSEMEVRLFQKLLTPTSNVIEVGANLGLHTVPLAKLVSKGKIICFEPQRVIFQMLCANIALNNLINVYAFQTAAGSTEGRVAIQTSDYDTPWNYGSFSIDKGMSTEGNYPGTVTIEATEVITLDGFPPANELPVIDLLKVDAEHQEINVLEGSAGLIAKHRPILFLENNSQERGDALISHIRSLDYDAYWFCSARYQPDNYNCVGYEIPGIDFNMVCFPSERVPANGLSPAFRFADLKDGKVPLVTSIQ